MMKRLYNEMDLKTAKINNFYELIVKTNHFF